MLSRSLRITRGSLPAVAGKRNLRGTGSISVAFSRNLSTAANELSNERPLRVGIVGSGPAAFYTAKYLLKEVPASKVDFLEALPTPYGLVRFGVAPDHPEVKLVQNDFATVASDPRCRFFGNVHVRAPHAVTKPGFTRSCRLAKMSLSTS